MTDNTYGNDVNFVNQQDDVLMPPALRQTDTSVLWDDIWMVLCAMDASECNNINREFNLPQPNNLVTRNRVSEFFQILQETRKPLVIQLMWMNEACKGEHMAKTGDFNTERFFSDLAMVQQCCVNSGRHIRNAQSKIDKFKAVAQDAIQCCHLDQNTSLENIKLLIYGLWQLDIFVNDENINMLKRSFTWFIEVYYKKLLVKGSCYDLYKNKATVTKNNLKPQDIDYLNQFFTTGLYGALPATLTALLWENYLKNYTLERTYRASVALAIVISLRQHQGDGKLRWARLFMDLINNPMHAKQFYEQVQRIFVPLENDDHYEDI